MIRDIVWQWAVETLKQWAGQVAHPIALTEQQESSLKSVFIHFTNAFSEETVGSILSSGELHPIPFHGALHSIFHFYTPLSSADAFWQWQLQQNGVIPAYHLAALGDIPPTATAPLDPGAQMKALQDWAEAFSKDLCQFPDPLCWWQNRFLVLKHGSFAAAGNTRSGRYWSLYVFIKVFLAVTHCLDKKFNSSAQPFCFVLGDLSGIQEFLHSGSQKRLLRMVRSRSFLLELMLRHMSTNLSLLAGIHDLSCVIRCGGGIFVLLLPNSPEIDQLLSSYRDKINTWFFDPQTGFDGRIFLALSWAKTSELSMPEEALHKDLELEKRRKFARVDPFRVNEIPGGETCTVCAVYKVRIDEGICGSCNQLMKLAARLGQGVRAIHPHFLDDEQGSDPTGASQGVTLPYIEHDGTVRTLHYSVENKAFPYGGRKDDKTSLPSYVVNALEPSDYLGSPGIEAEPIFLEQCSITCADLNGNPALRKDCREMRNQLRKEGYIERDDTPPEPFVVSTDLTAGLAIGNRKNALLKMDVDHLGFLQAVAAERGGLHLVAQATLSWHLELFFKLYLNQICSGKARDPDSSVFRFLHPELNGDPASEEHYFRTNGLRLHQAKRLQEEQSGINPDRARAHIIYAGGDDTTILGPWSDVFEVAYDIRKAFKRFTGDLDYWSISAGMVMEHHPGYPLRALIDETSRALESAKTAKKQPCLRCLPRTNCKLRIETVCCTIKDSASFFYEGWRDRAGQVLTAYYAENRFEPYEPLHPWMYWQDRRRQPIQAAQDLLHQELDSASFYYLIHHPVSVAGTSYTTDLDPPLLHIILPRLLKSFWHDDPMFSIDAAYAFTRLRQETKSKRDGALHKLITEVFSPMHLDVARIKSMAKWHMVIDFWQNLVRRS